MTEKRKSHRYLNRNSLHSCLILLQVTKWTTYNPYMFNRITIIVSGLVILLFFEREDWLASSLKAQDVGGCEIKPNQSLWSNSFLPESALPLCVMGIKQSSLLMQTSEPQKWKFHHANFKRIWKSCSLILMEFIWERFCQAPSWIL